MADNNLNNDLFGSRGVAAAEQRVRNRNNMARQYTQMSNGGNIPAAVPQSGSNNGSNSHSEPSVNNVPLPAAEMSEKPPDHEAANNCSDIMLPFGNIDGERLMLIMLIALLASEGTDFVLVAALIYLIM